MTSEPAHQDDSDSGSSEPVVPVTGDKAIRFEELAGQNREVAIEYAGQIYRLRVTRNGKLILNK